MPLSCTAHTSRNHPPLVCGKIVFHETSPWCQKDWGVQHLCLMQQRKLKLILQYCYSCSSVQSLRHPKRDADNLYIKAISQNYTRWFSLVLLPSDQSRCAMENPSHLEQIYELCWKVKGKGRIHSTSECDFISRQVPLDSIQCLLFLSQHNQNYGVDLTEYLEDTEDDFLFNPPEGGRILS